MRAHLAAYTDTALRHDPGWAIEVAGLRNSDTAGILNRQKGLYTLLVRDTGTTQARVVGAILRGLAPGDILPRMADPAIRIVSLTITEKAYGLNPSTGALDENHPGIAADLAAPDAPRSAVGLISAGLGARRAAGAAPFTPLSCDNLPGNGAVLRRLVLEYTVRHNPVLAEWIAANVPFPSTMVDRITPASTADTLADAARLHQQPGHQAPQGQARHVALGEFHLAIAVGRHRLPPARSLVGLHHHRETLVRFGLLHCGHRLSLSVRQTCIRQY